MGLAQARPNYMMTLEMGIIGSVIEALLDTHYKCLQWLMTIEMGIIGSVIEALLDTHYKCLQ